MKRGQEWRAAAATAAVTGAAFASGRGVVVFFSQMGRASWIGVGCASAMFGLLCGILCRFAQRTGTRTFAGVYMRLLGARRGATVGLVHGLLMVLTAGVMLAAAGKLFALTLPLYNAFWMGVLFTAIVALLLNLRGMRAMSAVGLSTVAICGAFYAALALDPREAAVHLRYETVLELNGSALAALLMAALHSALCASLGGVPAVCMADGAGRPARFGARCGMMMMILLSAANAAMMRGGERLFSQALPTALLAARWGKAGYYASAFVMWLCTATTLSAAIGALAGLAEAVRERRGS